MSESVVRRAPARRLTNIQTLTRVPAVAAPGELSPAQEELRAVLLEAFARGMQMRTLFSG